MKRIFILIFPVVLCFLYSCSANNTNNTGNKSADNNSAGSAAAVSGVNNPSETDGAAEAVYHSISPEDAKKMMDENSSYIILDVRTDAEYKDKHIPDAILIPNDQIKDRAETELPDKNALIFVYCRSGVRSSNASHALVDMGYTNIYDIGGIINWPYDTVSG